MSKKMLCLLALVLMVAFVSFSFAASQGVSKTVRDQANAKQPPARLPCSPCIGYGGDLDPNSANANGLASEKDIIVSDAEVVQAVVVPAGHTADVSALLANFLTIGCIIRPNQADWDIRSGVSSGNGGTVVASGTDTAIITSTGQTAFGLPECSVNVKFDNVHLTAGTYFFSVVPYCTDGGNSTCAAGQRYFMSDSPGKPPINGVGNVPGNNAFFNSGFFGANWQQTWGSSGACGGIGCNRFSLGVIGTRD